MTNLSGINLNNGAAAGAKREGKESTSQSLALMPKYEDYVDSGVEWLGDIPASWSLLANKHIFRLKKKQVGKRSSEYDLLSLTLRGVIKRDMENPEGKFPAEFDTYQEVQCGDFIFCLFDVEETPRTVGLSPFNGMITGAYTVFELNDNFDNRFLYYFYLNLDAKKRLKALYRGLRNTIPKDSFLSFKTFVPPHEQQTRIANFLDKKTAQIYDAIAIKEQQISLLKERKQIIIQQAVTQGLDPNVPMKDSGVDWIGKIPEHWEIKPLKHILKLQNVKIEAGKSNLEYLGMECVNSFDGTKNEIKSEADGLSTFFQVGNILFGKLRPYLAKVYVADFEGVCSTEFLVYEVKEGSNTFFSKLMLSNGFISVVDASTYGSKMPRASSDFIGNLKIVNPPFEEQIKIASFVDKQNELFDMNIALQKAQIEKLKEYKTTLINSAVTGKIKITPEMVEQ